MNKQEGPAANTYQCSCGNRLHMLQGNPKGQLWVACTKCGNQTLIVELLGIAAGSIYTKWKAMKAQRWAKLRGSKV